MWRSVVRTSQITAARGSVDVVFRQRPWTNHGELRGYMKIVISGSIAAIQPGVFVFITAGTLPSNKYQVWSLCDKKHGREGMELATPVVLSLVSDNRGGPSGASAGAFQARNVEAVFGLTTKSFNWRALKKNRQLMDRMFSTFANDLKIQKVAPRDQLQVTKEMKLQYMKAMVSTNLRLHLANLEKPPADRDDKRKWKRRHAISRKVANLLPLVWDTVEAADWMEIYHAVKAPSNTVIIDPQGGAGTKVAAAVSLGFVTRSCVFSEQHAQHLLQVCDFQVIKEMTRDGSCWWEKELHEKITDAFPQLLRTSINDA